MRSKRARWWGVVGLLLVLLPQPALAGPYLGDFGWCWQPSGDCQPTEYSWLHYWARGVYIVRAWCWPSDLDQYAPGLPVPGGAVYFPSGCRSIAPAPSLPYADPSDYYGVPLVPPPEEPKETKPPESREAK
jgi:hypothetical protein